MRIPSNLDVFFRQELEHAKQNLANNNLTQAWYHLERAHVLGQAYPFPHTLAHWRMLQFGFRIKSLKEVIGQLPRLLVGGVKSFVGTIPVGNTGGANIPPLKPLPIAEDLRILFEKAGVNPNKFR